MAKKRKLHQKPGPKAKTLQIDGDWQEAMKKALSKKKTKKNRQKENK